MPAIPSHPDLDQLRRQAKELLRAARTGDAAAIARIQAVSDALTLAAAQRALAREHGFPSWPRLKAALDARALDPGEKVDAFLRASIGGGIHKAARMLEEMPAIAGYGFATAVVLGDAGRVRAELSNDPALATRADPRTGWTAFHAACSSRWHQLEPARADGLLAVARLLLEAGADPEARMPQRPGGGGGMRPLRCVIAVANSGPSNRGIVELLLERGAVPDDHDLYLAGFAHDRHELLPLLIAHCPELSQVAEQALAAPISSGDLHSARLLLEAGADPRRYRDDDGHPSPVARAAVAAGCDGELLELLRDHHADPEAPGPDGRTAYQLATAEGRTDLAEVLRRHGAADTATATDTFLSACRRARRAEARRLLAGDPDLLRRLDDAGRAAIVRAASAGDTAAVALMLKLGFPVETRGEDGGTALHAASYAGHVETVRLLLDRGADVEARDLQWTSSPLVWASVGSGEGRDASRPGDWVEIVRTLLEQGASTADITLDPDDPKPPSLEVAALLAPLLKRG